MFHFGPIFQEIDFKLVSFIKENSKGEISLSLQGLVRQVKNDKIYIASIPGLDKILKLVDLLFANEAEIKTLLSNVGLKDLNSINKLGPRVVVVTRGEKGSAVFSDKTCFYIPLVKTKEVKDPTGAGDAFVGGFISEYLKSRNIELAALIGSAAASFVVENYGPSRFPKDSNEIFERLKKPNFAL